MGEYITILLEKIDEFISSLSIADYLVITVAFIGVWSNARTNKRVIDADVKSKSRIEWIQSVRNITADLLSLYYRLLNEIDKSKVYDEYREVKEKTELLILYFGPEDLPKGPKANNNLHNCSSNEGKNDDLILFLDELYSGFQKHCENISINKLEVLKKARNDSLIKMEDSAWENSKKIIDTVDIEGQGKIDITGDYKADEDLQRKDSLIENNVIKYESDLKELEKKLVDFRNIMRIYLKLEWKIAKSGK